MSFEERLLFLNEFRQRVLDAVEVKNDVELTLQSFGTFMTDHPLTDKFLFNSALAFIASVASNHPMHNLRKSYEASIAEFNRRIIKIMEYCSIFELIDKIHPEIDIIHEASKPFLRRAEEIVSETNSIIMGLGNKDALIMPSVFNAARNRCMSTHAKGIIRYCIPNYTQHVSTLDFPKDDGDNELSDYEDEFEDYINYDDYNSATYTPALRQARIPGLSNTDAQRKYNIDVPPHADFDPRMITTFVESMLKHVFDTNLISACKQYCKDHPALKRHNRHNIPYVIAETSWIADGFQDVLFNFINDICRETWSLSYARLYSMFYRNRPLILTLISRGFIKLDDMCMYTIRKIGDLGPSPMNSSYEIGMLFRNDRRQYIVMKDNKWTIDSYVKLIDRLAESKFNITNDIDSYILNGVSSLRIIELIAEDNIEEFITYITETNYDIEKIFKNPSELLFSVDKLEYYTCLDIALYYGAFNILKYLHGQRNMKFNTVPIWTSNPGLRCDISEATPIKNEIEFKAVHGNNPEIIHYLEDNNIKIDGYKLLKYAITMNNDDMTEYIFNNHDYDRVSIQRYAIFASNFKYLLPEPDFIGLFNNDIFKPALYALGLGYLLITHREELYKFDDNNENFIAAVDSNVKTLSKAIRHEDDANMQEILNNLTKLQQGGFVKKSNILELIFMFIISIIIISVVVYFCTRISAYGLYNLVSSVK